MAIRRYQLDKIVISVVIIIQILIIRIIQTQNSDFRYLL